VPGRQYHVAVTVVLWEVEWGCDGTTMARGACRGVGRGVVRGVGCGVGDALGVGLGLWDASSVGDGATVGVGLVRGAVVPATRVK